MLWGRRKTSRELREWRGRAELIPDAQTRTAALEALVDKRDNAEGASLFAILPKHRDNRLLRLLVAYQVMWDFLDSVSERGACAGETNGQQLHRALVEALDLDAPVSDYYRYHPWKDDGGFLRELVATCRSLCAELPSYRAVRRTMLEGVKRCAIQGLNHELDPQRRDLSLRAWAESEPADVHALEWFEVTAAASAFVPHVLLALAAEPACESHELAAVQGAYFPWVALAIAMLDSYVDQVEDATSGSHSYISHYASEALALERLTTIVKQVRSRARRLPNGRRHTVIASSMIAMYLSKSSANTPQLRTRTRVLARAGGLLTVLLLPAAGAWRMTGAGRAVSRMSGKDLPAGLRIPRVAQTYVFWRAPFVYYRRCRRCCGSRFTLRAISHPPLVFFADPGHVREMLTAPADMLHPGEGGVTIAPIVGLRSFMLLDEDEHLRGRRAVLPVLHKSAVAEDVEQMTAAARAATASWPRDVSLALHPRLRALTLEVILRRVFGEDEHGLAARSAMLRDTVLAMLAVTGSVVFPLPSLRRGPGRIVWRRFLKHRDEVDCLIYALADERRHKGRAGRSERRGDALAALLAARGGDGEPMSSPELRDNVMSLILAGHETTASQLAWAFQLLAHNPAVQRRLIEEIDADGDGAYLTATIQEVLRHRPVFLFTIPRAVKQPIEIGGWTYRPPAHLLGCIYLLHHDPGVYPEPDEFRPERFLEGQPGPQAWLPWGGGRRRCPGSHLALLEMKAVLRAVLETATVHPVSRRMERPRWRSVIVTPHAGSRVLLRARERRSTPGARRRRRAVRGPVRTRPVSAGGQDRI